VIGLPVPATKAPLDAPIVTEPAVVPVIVMLARPAMALTEKLDAETLPVPAVFAKVTLNVLSVPVVMVLPPLS